jgi:plasmid maintenance system killer protein
LYRHKKYTYEVINRVTLTKYAQKDLIRTPVHILKKFRKWVGDIERYGLDEVRKVRGWNDHSLQGDRKGQRAIYLNSLWRAIYVIEDDGTLYVSVVEVNPHEYKK